MKIVVLDGYTENPGDLSWEGFWQFGEVTVYDRTEEEEIINRIGDAQAVITNKTPITRETLNACPDIQIPTYGTAAVGQFAIALLLEICHHIGHHDKAVHDGRWQNCPDWCFWDYPLIELTGKTMGIIGFGRIGQATGAIAKALGMKVLAYDEYPNETGHGIGENVSLDQLFEKADVIALHCPLLPETEGIICRDNIAKMKDGVIIINNSRGLLIVEQDLYDALESGKVFAAGLDVVSSEPIREDNILLKAKTPHISWASRESRSRLMDIAAANLGAFIDGNAVNVVNL